MKYLTPALVILCAIVLALVVWKLWLNNPSKNVQETTQPDQTITIEGKAEETMDGYYIAGYFVPHDSIRKYDLTYILGRYTGNNLKIMGKSKDVFIECEKDAQCASGNQKMMYDIQLVQIIE